MPRARVGVALLVPPPVDAEVDALRKACGDGALGRLPAHCTLVPPVNVRDDRVADAVDVLHRAAARTRPFGARLGPAATFHPVTPVLHLPVHAEPLRALRDLVFVEPLHRPLTHGFVPHVTLADDADPHLLPHAVQVLRHYTADVTFDRVHLLEEGPDRVWHPIAEARFGGPPVVGRGGLPLELARTDELDPAGRAFTAREWPPVDVDQFGPGYRPSRPLAVTARREGEVVGAATGWTGGGLGYLSELLVGRAVRGEGIGSHLLAAFVDEAAARGARSLALRAVAGEPAEDFYRRHGWTEECRFTDWQYGRDYVQFRRRL